MQNIKIIYCDQPKFAQFMFFLLNWLNEKWFKNKMFVENVIN